MTFTASRAVVRRFHSRLRLVPDHDGHARAGGTSSITRGSSPSGTPLPGKSAGAEETEAGAPRWFTAWCGTPEPGGSAPVRVAAPRRNPPCTIGGGRGEDTTTKGAFA